MIFVISSLVLYLIISSISLYLLCQAFLFRFDLYVSDLVFFVIISLIPISILAAIPIYLTERPHKPSKILFKKK
jgi:hypothetical protein